jgi:acyl-coenzyme A thioesterase PaaI-like protein
MSTPAERLESAWRRLSELPGGRRLFAFILGRMVPYSGSVKPEFLEIRPGLARVAIQDRRRLRNHLRSVHAIALANLGELSSGLAMTMALPPGARGIPVRIEVDYLKKARGRILAEGRADPPAEVTGPTEARATATLTDEQGDTVASVVVVWTLSPAGESGGRAGTGR